MSEEIKMKITGEFLTNHYRTKLLSQEWQEALDGLSNNLLKELPTNIDKNKIAIDILMGKKKIEGVVEVDENKLFITDDLDSADYIKTLNSVYNDDLFLYNNELYSCMSVVTLPTLAKDGCDDIMDTKISIHKIVNIDTARDEIKEYDRKNDCFYYDCDVISYNDMVYIYAKKKDKNFIPIWLRKDDCSLSSLIEEKRKKNLDLDLTLKAIDLFEKNEKNITNFGLEKMSIHSKILAINVYKQAIEKNIQWIDVEFEYKSKKPIKLSVPILLFQEYLDERRKIFNPESKGDSIIIENQYWEPVCESGYKMNGDSPIHSDLWLSLCFDLEKAYETTEDRIFWLLLQKYMEDQFDLNKIVLLNKIDMLMNSAFVGTIKTEDSAEIRSTDILVLPNANLKYAELAKKAGAVIVESGSQLSHIALKGKDECLPVVLFPKALSKLKEGIYVKIDFKNQKIFEIKLDFKVKNSRFSKYLK